MYRCSINPITNPIPVYGIAQSVLATDYGWTTKGSVFESRWGKEFLFLHVVQTGSGAQSASYPMWTGGYFPGVKRPRREANHSSPTSAEVKKTWVYTCTPPYVFMV
jgi:hypothetical protein